MLPMPRRRFLRFLFPAPRVPRRSVCPTVQQLEGRDTPSALQVVVNDGSAQRSMVTGLTVNFNQVVRFAGAPENATAAFALRGPTGPVALTVDLSGSTPGQTV